MRAALGKPAPDIGSNQGWNGSRDFIEPRGMPTPAISQSWHRFEKTLGVRMKGLIKYVCHMAFLDDLAGVHDHYPRGHLGHDPQIMCNQQNRHIQF